MDNYGFPFQEKKEQIEKGMFQVMRTKLVLWSALIWNMAINAAYPEPSFVFTTPVPVEELNSPRIDWAPWLSADGLTGYIGSDRDDSWTIYHI